MLKRFCAATLFLTMMLGLGHARAASYGDGGQVSSPLNADLIIKVPDSSIRYRADGHMLVCIDKADNSMCDCNHTKDALTLYEFLRWYFPGAPKMKIIAMDYRTYYSTYIFWLKR
jgi:hypothetical protein